MTAKKTVLIQVTPTLIERVPLLEMRERNTKASVVWRGAPCEILASRIVKNRRESLKS